MVAFYLGFCGELMGLESPWVHDVLSGDVLGKEMITQQSSVAVPEEFLCAHDGCPLTSGGPKEILDAQAKLLGEHVIRVVAKGDGLEGLIRGGLFT
jgi:hypothetical protein